MKSTLFAVILCLTSTAFGVYTDEQLVELIKNNLNERLAAAQPSKEPQVQAPSPTISAEDENDIFSSTAFEEFDFESTEMPFVEPDDEVVIEATDAFTNGFPAMYEVVTRLEEIQEALYNEEIAADDKDVEETKNKIQTLLVDYETVETKTNELLAAVGAVEMKEEQRRELIEEDMERSTGYAEEDVFVPIVHGLYSDSDAILATMQTLLDTIDGLENYSDLDDEEKRSLEVMMDNLLNAYEVLMEDKDDLKYSLKKVFENESTM